jgi:TrmH family RNA methyltransferase
MGMLVKQKSKYIQTLGQKKHRDEDGVFIAEGPKLVAELLHEVRSKVKELFATEDWIEENEKLIGKINITAVKDFELEKISSLSTPNKVLAIVEQFDAQEPVVKGNIILALDSIQDPGNMGTILRIADWFGIKHIVCSNDSADIYNPKVVQSTMGSIARVQVYYTDLVKWIAEQKDARVYAAMLEGQDIGSMKKIDDGILVIGNESKGISDNVLGYVNVRLTIPKKGRAESLNAAVAVGIILSVLV